MLGGDAKKAIASFDTALELQPALAEARYNRGVAYLRSSNPSRAAAEFAAVHAIEGSPLRARAAYHHALALDALKRPKDAEAWLDRAIALDPALDSALLYLGFLRERRGDLQGAGKAYKQFLERHPESLVAMLRFGVAAQRSGFADLAKRYLNKVIESAPESFEAAEARKFLVMWE